MSHGRAADTATNPRLRAALKHAKRGRLVFPCHSAGPTGCSCGNPACERPGKHPRISGGLNAASCDPATIQQWWAEWPDARPALCTGEGFVPIGVDGPEGKRAPHVDVKGNGGHVTADLPPVVSARAVGDQPPRQVTSKRTAPQMRHGKVPYACARVVKACRSLTATQKLIWLEHHGLANGKGGAAWISASGLARRIGLSRVTVERARQEYVRFGLISKKSRGAGRTDDWFPHLPSSCVPNAQRPTDDEVERYAELLDAHVASLSDSSLTGEGGRGAD